MTYREEYRESIDFPEKFWDRQSKLISWFKKPDTILSQDKKGYL